jgi:hypothetical protein
MDSVNHSSQWTGSSESPPLWTCALPVLSHSRHRNAAHRQLPASYQASRRFTIYSFLGLLGHAIQLDQQGLRIWNGNLRHGMV